MNLKWIKFNFSVTDSNKIPHHDSENTFLEIFTNSLKMKSYCINKYSNPWVILCSSAFGNDYSFESSWVCMYQLCPSGFGDFLILPCSLGGRPALGRVWVVPCSFHFLMMELIVLLGTFNILEIILYPSPDLCLLTILSRSSTGSSLDFIVEFLLWHALSTVGPYIERCVSFQIMCNQLNWPQVDSNTSCRDISRMIKGNWIHLS